MKRYYLQFLFISYFIMTSCNNSSTQPSDSKFDNTNSFYQQSTLPFETFEFSKLKNSDFAPAFDEGIKIQNKEIDSIANNNESPTFENTLVALEKSGQLLSRVQLVFGLLNSANTNDSLQQIDEIYAPKFAAQSDAIYLNNKLFKRVETIFQQKDNLSLDEESKRLIDYYYQLFKIAGATLSDAQKVELKKLNAEEASLNTKFNSQLLSATKAASVIFNNKNDLEGLPEADIEAAASAAKEANQGGKYLLSLQNTTQQPYLSQLKNRAVREKIFKASWDRAELNDSNDTRQIILKLANILAKKAKLLGFPNYATWKLQDQMAKTPSTVYQFLNQLVPATVAKGKKEAEDIQNLIKSQGDTFNLEPWDWDYYAEQVRKSKYDIDESQLKPYFILDSVLINGVFYAASELYGISFIERKDIPVYHSDVRVFEVRDTNDAPLALFYCDFYKRDNKNGGAWMSNIVNQSYLLNKKPVVYNICNFTKPANGQPAFISFDDVTTMFHEFGHALHGIFAAQQYPSLSGTNTSRDFVEFPSQFNEHWATYPQVLKNYAKHYQSGNSLPQSLVEKIKKAGTFNQGYSFGEYLAATGLDLAWHTINTKVSTDNVDTFEKDALQKFGTNLNYIPPRYRSSYFLHIWSNGYSAGYYAYCWSEMLDNDAYEWFEENGGLNRKNGQYFREHILSRGNSEDLATLYKKFRGKDASIKPLLKNRGLE